MAKPVKKTLESIDIPGRIAWVPPKVADHVPEIYALQALAAGRASEHQQKLAMTFIVKVLSLYPEWGFRPEGETATLIVLGRQFVGAHISSFVNMNMAKFRNPNDDTEHGQ